MEVDWLAGPVHLGCRIKLAITSPCVAASVILLNRQSSDLVWIPELRAHLVVSSTASCNAVLWSSLKHVDPPHEFYPMKNGASCIVHHGSEYSA